jgi:hypothetical protein
MLAGYMSVFQSFYKRGVRMLNSTFKSKDVFLLLALLCFGAVADDRCGDILFYPTAIPAGQKQID